MYVHVLATGRRSGSGPNGVLADRGTGDEYLLTDKCPSDVSVLAVDACLPCIDLILDVCAVFVGTRASPFAGYFESPRLGLLATNDVTRSGDRTRPGEMDVCIHTSCAFPLVRAVLFRLGRQACGLTKNPSLAHPDVCLGPARERNILLETNPPLPPSLLSPVVGNDCCFFLSYFLVLLPPRGLWEKGEKGEGWTACLG